MGRALRWTYKLLRAWRNDGFKGAVKAGVDRIILKGEAQDHDYSAPQWTVWDVLFVNGCPPEQLPHPYRYRVLHQMEQLKAAGYTVGEVSDADCGAGTALMGNVIVFYRCPFTEGIGEAIRQARTMNKRIIFDIDDLVIDTLYTDTIPAVRAMNPAERALYDDGVKRYGMTMRMCDAATTTTTAMRWELLKYLPKVYLNRNCASERMVELSEAAWKNGKQAKAALLQSKNQTQPERPLQDEGIEQSPGVILGYFSGSLTHNADFEMIKPAVLRILEEKPEVKLLLMGQLDMPPELKPFESRVIQKTFMDWEELPEVIAGVDLNLAPVETSLFNEAKSENKWVEAALVKVATVASRMGAFAELIQDGVTGYLAGDDQWYEVLKKAVEHPEERREIGENARRYCLDHCVTTANTGRVREIYEQVRAPHAGFVLPSSEMSGGIMVALRHACFLQDAGWNVDIIAHHAKSQVWEEFGHVFSCISFGDGGYENLAEYDLLIGTMWTTLAYIRNYPRVRCKAYLVQNMERDFYAWNDPQRLDCESTYCLGPDWHYLTVSPWCEGWLKDQYHQQAGYLPNGLDREKYRAVKRDWTGRKIRVLIEGDCAAEYKNVDESFAAVELLDPEKYEVWYMSYNARPKESYRVDRFLHAVPYEETPDIYAQCDILVKSSWLESFSYPPLEMMATGGFCVLVQNGGNSEYVRDGENCLVYPRGDPAAAAGAVERIVQDAGLREKLRAEVLKTADAHDWQDLKAGIVEQYQQLMDTVRSPGVAPD